MKFPTYEELGEKVAKEALDTFEYNGKTLREWIEIISATEHGTNLAEVGTDYISRQAAIESFRTYFMDGFDEDKWWNSTHVLAAIEGLPPAEPKRETATVSVGKSKGGVTMWYECAVCGEPVDQGDTFCSGCGRRLIHE